MSFSVIFYIPKTVRMVCWSEEGAGLLESVRPERVAVSLKCPISLIHINMIEVFFLKVKRRGGREWKTESIR